MIRVLVRGHELTQLLDATGQQAGHRLLGQLQIGGKIAYRLAQQFATDEDIALARRQLLDRLDQAYLKLLLANLLRGGRASTGKKLVQAGGRISDRNVQRAFEPDIAAAREVMAGTVDGGMGQEPDRNVCSILPEGGVG